MAEMGTLGLPTGLPSNDLLALQPNDESGSSQQAISVGTGQLNDTLYGDQFARYVAKEMARAEPHVMAQREAWKEADRFMHSHQLSEEDKLILKSQKRPDTVINEVQKFIRFAGGIERRSRQALLYVALTADDQEAQLIGEAESKKYDWFSDQSQLDFERSLAFEDLVIGGIGVVDYGLSRIVDPQGAPRGNKCDPCDFWWPGPTGKQNLGLGTPSPVRWLARETDMDVDESVRKWPAQALFLRAAAGGPANEDQFPDFGYGAKKTIPYVVPWIMTAPLNKGGGGGSEGKPGKCRILEWQYYEDQPGFYFVDPMFGDDTWLSRSDFFKYNARLRALYKTQITDYDEVEHRVYKRAYLLQRRILLQDPKVLPTRDQGYTWNFMTAWYDGTDKVFYGLTRPLMAPQRYTNAMFRQTLEIMGASTKGGLLAETGAMTPAQRSDYLENRARPGYVGFVQAGAISGNRVKELPIPQIPQGSMQVLQFCMSVMEQIVGLSTSLLGNDQGNTPGVSLRKRFTAGMVLLAPLFDALSRFRRREGYLVSEFMRLLSDGRIVRIIGRFDSQALALTKNPDYLKFGIKLDENDQDPDLRRYYMDQVAAIAPILIRTGNFIPELLDYFPLPQALLKSLKEGIAKSEQQKMQMAQQGLVAAGGRGKPRGLEEIQADVGIKHARTAKDIAQAYSTFKSVGRDSLKSVFDIMHDSRSLKQEDSKLTLDALAKLFAALKPEAPRAES